jgi:hypothetical protein
VRQATQAGDVEAAFQAIRESIRYGLYMIPRKAPLESWAVSRLNMHRVAWLRLLGYCGWREASELLQALPIDDPAFPIHSESGRPHAREGGPSPPGHGWGAPEGSPERQAWIEWHAREYRRVIPKKPFDKLGPQNAEEVGSAIMSVAALAAVSLTRPLFQRLAGLDPMALLLAQPYDELDLRRLRYEEVSGGAFLRAMRDPAEDALAQALGTARHAWSALKFHQQIARQTDRIAHESANVIERAVEALALECQSGEPDGAPRAAGWGRGFTYGRRCGSRANKAVKAAMLPAVAITVAGQLGSA